jgi:hypothetical protein
MAHAVSASLKNGRPGDGPVGAAADGSKHRGDGDGAHNHPDNDGDEKDAAVPARGRFHV